MNILDYRVVILNNEGKIIKYPFSFGMHQDCLDDFSLNSGFEYSSCDYIVDKGNVVFSSIGNEMLIVRLPNVLNERQLYSLDYIENWLDKVSYMEVGKGNSKNMEVYIYSDDVRKNFSDEVIQSYYNVKGKKK